MLDLLAEFHLVLSERKGSLRLIWTKGHPTQAQAENMLFVSDVEAYLKKAADRIADWAAEKAQLDDNSVSLIVRADELAVQ
eukprot:2619116-Pyramimonas_sp.AAC.1